MTFAAHSGSVAASAAPVAPPDPSATPLSVSLGRPPRSRWMIPAALLLLSGVAAVVSTGFLEADEITHFLHSKKVWVDWRSLLSIWGRLGCTAIYALGAPFGLTWARLIAVVVTALVGFGTVRLLKALASRDASTISSRHAVALAWLLLYAQPMFALNSFTVMTEMLLACTWVWAAVVLACRIGGNGGKNLLLAAAILGLGGLMRPEGWLAIAAWPLFAWTWLSSRPPAELIPFGRRINLTLLSTFAAGAPCLGWYLLGVYGYSDGFWMIAQFPWSARSPYATSLQRFLYAAAVSMGIWMWLPILIGTIVTLRRRGTRLLAATQRIDAILLLVVPLVCVFGVHGILGSLGLMGSMSLPRYFLCVSPMAVILAIVGLHASETTVRRPWLRRIGLLIALGMPIFSLGQLAFAGLIPMWQVASTSRMDLATDEVRRRLQPAQYPTHLILGHPYLNYKLGIILGGATDAPVFSAEKMAQAPPGTILVYQQNLWQNEKHWSEQQLADWGFREDLAFAAQSAKIQEKRFFNLEKGDAARVRMWVKER